MATATSELRDEVADPTPVRALRRISVMAGPVDTGAQDGLLLRAARYVALAPLVYRVFAVPGALVGFLATTGGPGTAVVVAVAVCSLLLNLYGVRWMLRSAPFRPAAAVRLLTLDVVFTVAANLAVGLAVPPAAFEAAADVPGKHLLGAIALLTLAVGMPWGLALLAADVPLHGTMYFLSSGQWDFGIAVGRVGSMLGVLFTATGALILLGLGTRLALAYGIRNGMQAEQARQHRRIHDTVLQTLEAMSLPGAGPPEEQLAQLRRLARAQASELRRAIEADGMATNRPLGEKLASLATEMARDGLRAQVVIAELDAATLDEVRQIAIRDAVREAMRNTMKHSGTDHVVVRVEERDGGIAVITRDHGTGFSAENRPPGFGISESITARLAEVGGTATVESAPGNGTRVTLWVPC
ncbi:ATP-binding protein [Amycolatopsis suaedae]|uniref:ATP-binding protein n=2 Tax=Amycolatopsis suaedae TaxID=2510978 RepID=A0A4V2EML0_9PSEU|nr:ATP-binding protein [Amycolatopsis suaedae]